MCWESSELPFSPVASHSLGSEDSANNCVCFQTLSFTFTAKLDCFSFFKIFLREAMFLILYFPSKEELFIIFSSSSYVAENITSGLTNQE